MDKNDLLLLLNEIDSKKPFLKRKTRKIRLDVDKYFDAYDDQSLINLYHHLKNILREE